MSTATTGIAELFDVSVVVDCPAGTDPKLLRATVASILDQTLAGAEAALTGEGTGATGAALAADHPHRVRVGAPAAPTSCRSRPANSSNATPAATSSRPPAAPTPTSSRAAGPG
ncbi:hypothetical protein V2W30_15735 [Streptomyces sp. Q6]|uniref:Uncharacterized protein n=1 Tax=Streptomyces citrinus TaxID=3118173 RepID=A0ACD5ABY8_9ACTN